MASTIEYKDLATGNIVTVNHDPNHTVTIAVPNTTTEWTMTAVDPEASEVYYHVGCRKKR